MPFRECMQLAAQWPLVEVRLDLLQASPEKIDLLAMQCRQWIVACRPGTLSERERTVLLAAAMRAGATYADIEYEAEPGYRQPLADLARQCRCKLIISYHDFDSTPDADRLDFIVESAREMGADCVKIATMARCSADCARIMALYERHDNIAAFAMGEEGTITRIAAPFLGAAFTFASVDERRSTAPGQLTASQMKHIYQNIAQSVKN